MVTAGCTVAQPDSLFTESRNGNEIVGYGGIKSDHTRGILGDGEVGVGCFGDSLGNVLGAEGFRKGD